jgi:hypothetical protein
MIKHEKEIAYKYTYENWNIGDFADFSIYKTDKGKSYSLWLKRRWIKYDTLSRRLEFRKVPF